VKQKQLVNSLLLASSIWCWGATSVAAQEAHKQEVQKESVASILRNSQNTGTASDLLAQGVTGVEVTSHKSQVRSQKLAQNSQQTLTRVTGVEVKQTPKGLELILKTVIPM
jgi:iron complex outermembrane recepter protein